MYHILMENNCIKLMHCQIYIHLHVHVCRSDISMYDISTLVGNYMQQL